MQRSHIPLILVAPLVFAACTAESETSERQPQTDADQSDPVAADGAAPSTDTTEANAAGVDSTDPAQPDSTQPAQAQPTQPPATKRPPTFGFESGGSIADEALGDYHVVMSASVDGEDVGSMKMALWGDKAPVTVRNFLRLVDEGFYDGVTFHRIIRDFMVQGGDPTGTGGGNSPYGTIVGEFSPDPDRAHEYGVLSMARTSSPDSASCQFFICCDTEKVKALDGQYATFGRLTGGVATLEAIANVRVTGPQRSSPTVSVVITKAEAVKGPAPESGEEMKRQPPPPIDLGGEPESIVIQHVLISFAGTPVPATRTQEEAEKLAGELLELLQGGEDFETVLLANSDDKPQDWDETPGVYRLLNWGVQNLEAEAAMTELGKEFQETMQAIQARQTAGELTPEAAQEEMSAVQVEIMQRAEPIQWEPRGQGVPGFGDVGFKLEVGEIGMASYDAQKSPFGWHIIKRLE